MTRLVALTGATGFIGGHILNAIAERGFSARVLSRRKAHIFDVAPEPEIIHGALEDYDALERLCADADIVIHCAGLVKARNRAEFEAGNGAATSRLVEIARKANVVRFVHISSLAAREPQLSDYAASKASAERAVQDGAGALNWTIIRPPAVYGPGDREFIKAVGTARFGVLPAPASAGRFSIIHAEDLARAILDAAASETLNARTFEPDDGQLGGYDWRDIAQILSEALGHKVRVLRVPGALLSFSARLNSLIASLRGRTAIFTPGKAREFNHSDWTSHPPKLEDATPWRPTIDFKTGLDETLAWARANGVY